MKKTVFTILLSFYFIFLYAQREYHGAEANKIIQGAEIVYFSPYNQTYPTFVKFYTPISKDVFINKLRTELKSNINFISSEKDPTGYEHLTYQQYIDTIPIEWAIVKLHVKNNKVLSVSGNVWKDVNIRKSLQITPNKAIDIALRKHNAQQYMWEDEYEEKLLQTITRKEHSTYKPKPTLVYYKDKENIILSYKLTIYSKYPLSKKGYYISAEDGSILNVIEKIQTADVQGTAITKYSGQQTITTDSYNGNYRLRESGRGNGIFTFNMQNGTDYNAAVDFTDDDNFWNNFNANLDEVATDAHWATEKYYDYFYSTFNRNSIDNNGFALYNYVHASLVGMGFSNNVNAFWDGTRMTYGDGNSTYSPLTTVDIVAHEITHGLTEFTANLVYQDESGALNEGFSDIFGTVVEFYAKPSMANWTIGEDIGAAFRSLANPKQFNDPDTYLGSFWDMNGEVHQNSTVFSHWFYLLSQGGSGTNDLGNNFQVNGIGMQKAANIAYRTLVYYLPPNSTYYDARFFSILSAIDLYGACSPEVEAATNAMYAVGVGSQYQNSVIANFSANITQSCQAPFTVSFTNTSSNGQSFTWYFGDGTTSTDLNPVHTYTDTGIYTVTLIVNGGTCGSDTLTITDYISIVPQNPCVVIMPLNGTGNTITSCQGTLYDGGGPDGNYADMSDAIITISPTGANTVTLTFLTFDIEPGSGTFCDYDYVEIFDGPSINSPSFGKYCNTTGSPGTIQSTGNSLTILLHSDQAVTKAGFSATWTCEILNVPPLANFNIQPVNTCSGLISFIDQSSHNPTSWLWDFGDGTFSTLQNPTHEYEWSGSYTVTLVVSNSFGSDTITYENAVSINRPDLPVIFNDTICENEQAMLTASGTGTILWYHSFTDTIPFYTGDTLFTPILNQTTTYYAQNAILNPPAYVGDTRSSSDGSFFNNSSIHYLVFDCFTECELVSVEVNAASAGNRTISLLNASNNLITSRTVNIPQGISRIPLNILLPVQSNLKLAGPAYPNLWRNNNLVAFYPYTIPGVLSIKSSSASSNPTGYYYYFYNWEIKLPDCYSTKIPVIAFVDNCNNLHHKEQTINLQVFPNPAQDLIYIKANSPVETIAITDVYGKRYPVLIQLSSANTLSVNTSDFANGLYFIYIKLSGEYYTQKILIYR